MGWDAISAQEQDLGDAGETGWRTDWEKDLEDDMLAQIAMEESLGESAATGHGRVPSHGKGQKKKKFKKVTLMTNGGKRGA